ncbi:hypothetical protein [Streptomyces tendae]|uniref:hypothetical protein n=1 Tax=Streptomyces tendae TaxID=1932 RepID=UPI002493A93B|nr:hypothetical protein [Streptomyces tendae]
MTTTGTPTEPRYAWGRRGRHRRPRPRKVLLAAGGLALAAGALSVVRLLPEPGGDPGAFGAGAGPRVEGPGRGAAPDRAASPGAAATGGGPPGASPSATSAMGGLSGSPAPDLVPGLVPGPSASDPTAPRPAATTGPDGLGTPEGRSPGQGEPTDGEGGDPEDPGDRAPSPGAPQPSRSDGTAPPPPPDRGTPPTSDPEPEPDDPGLCVPVIGLCVDLLRG